MIKLSHTAYRQYLLITTLILRLTWSAHSQTEHKSPEAFDIVSVRLHMTGSEVIDVLHSRFKAPIDPVKGINVVRISGKYDPKMTYVSHVQYRTKEFSIDIDFVESFPVSSHRREAAYRISYLARTATQSDIIDFQRRVNEKYGPPTSANQPAGGDVWCQSSTCDLDEPFLSAKPVFDGGFGLNLHDEGLRRRAEQAFNKSRQTSAPL